VSSILISDAVTGGMPACSIHESSAVRVYHFFLAGSRVEAS
jgi:hypothetical protein